MPEFEQYLHNLFAQRASSKVKDAMMYSLLNQGKRIRPKLLFAVLRAYGLKEEKGYCAAAAIEMIHTYSLIYRLWMMICFAVAEQPVMWHLMKQRPFLPVMDY